MDAEERELTPEEAALEDRLVTMAEYGAELEAEEDHEPVPDPTQKTSGELQFIEPINYAEIIANMDEDMRTAMEILISDCSCYTPFKPFLMDLVATNDLFMPNKLDYLSAVVLHDRQEHKAYANNEYGLVEYTLKPFEIEAVAEGPSNKEIAEKLFIIEGTVKNYVTSILAKENLSHRTALAVYYLTGKKQG